MSSVTLVGLLDKAPLDPRVSILSPCGPSVVFLCGLLQVFNQCHPPAGTQNPLLTHDQSRDTLYHSVTLLEKLAPVYEHHPSSEDALPLLSLAGALARLQCSLDGQQESYFDFNTTSMNHAEASGLSPPAPETQVDMWMTADLGTLNWFEDFDIIFGFLSDFG